MSNTNGGCHARKTINLTSEQYISDRVNELPTTAGMHLVVAPTGAGKSHAMTLHSNQNNGAVIFPVKAVMQQQLQETQRRGINANIYQLERFDGTVANEVDVIHFDECQLIYEGGFRKEVERFTALLIEQSKSKPVYCYSATYLEEIDFVKWDSVTVFDKGFARDYTVIQVQKDDELVEIGKQVRQYRTAFANAIVGARLETNVVTLAFVNSKSKCHEIREEILSTFPHFKVEISCSETNQTSDVIQHIMATSTVTDCGADIILSTSSLEAGININDPVCIVSEQTEAGKLFQRFGRARKVGYYYLIAGSGTGRVELLRSGVTVADEKNDLFFTIGDREHNTLSQYMNSTCKFDNREHARACDRYQSYIEQCDSLRNTVTVLDRVEQLGYKFAGNYTVDTSDNGVKCKRGSKTLLCTCLRNHIDHGKKDHGDDMNELVSEVATALEIDRLTANIHIQKFFTFSSQIALVDNIKQDALTVFEKLTVNGQNFILSMSRNESTDGGFENELHCKVGKVIKMVKGAAGNVVMTGDKLDEWCSNFWTAVVDVIDNKEWFGDDNTRTRTNLFRYLMGWVEMENRHWVILDEKAWWDVELSRAEQVKKVRMTKELDANGYELGQVCEHLRIDSKELLNSVTPKKLIKSLRSDADWGQSASSN